MHPPKTRQTEIWNSQEGFKKQNKSGCPPPTPV